MSKVAECAKLIRKDLKEKFPNIKFSVRSSSFSMGNDVNVRYENGVPTREVEDILGKYKDGSFDGMEDIYNYRPNPDNLPRTKYLFVDRQVSPEIKKSTKKEIAELWGIEDINDEQEWYKKRGMWSDQAVWRELKDKTL